jgi:hypothetical protein
MEAQKKISKMSPPDSTGFRCYVLPSLTEQGNESILAQFLKLGWLDELFKENMWTSLLYF